jgi:hypothetical protein
MLVKIMLIFSFTVTSPNKLGLKLAPLKKSEISGKVLILMFVLQIGWKTRQTQLVWQLSLFGIFGLKGMQVLFEGKAPSVQAVAIKVLGALQKPEERLILLLNEDSVLDSLLFSFGLF